MTQSIAPTTSLRATGVAIACGGTGGHLFPGLAVAEQLVRRGCAVTLLISPKDVDQQAVKQALERRAADRPEQIEAKEHAVPETGVPMEVVTLPAVGLQNGNYFSFARSFWRSYRIAKKYFQAHQPQAALAMGGFTSAPPILAAKSFGARTFLHESNTIPGRANRWLSRVVNQAFVGFPQAGARLHTRNFSVTGTPVRPQFQPLDAAACRTVLGLEANRPVLLVMGGSQGASGINELVLKTLPLLAKRLPQLQLIHLTGPNDVEKVKQICASLNVSAVVHPFFTKMELALGAATICISRSGASSLAELAAMRVPSVLIPFPAATDNHQFYNAKAFKETDAAYLLEQKNATPEILAGLILELIENPAARETMQAALAQWHAPKAAEQIAEIILAEIAHAKEHGTKSSRTGHSCCSCKEHRTELRAKAVA